MDGVASEPADSTESHAPRLKLNGFSGPLDLLLSLARAQRIDLRHLSLRDLVQQLAPALQQAATLAERGDWLVMAAWLVLLRSRLLLPPATSARQAAQRQVGRLRGRLLGLERAQALAAWLDHRPQLERDVFGRGMPDMNAVSRDVQPEVDVVEFLWACLALFEDDDQATDTTTSYQPRRLALHSVAEARARILQRLAATVDAQTLGQLLPHAPVAQDGASRNGVMARSAWTSTFTASLELAKQGEVILAQDSGFAPINVSKGPSARTCDPGHFPHQHLDPTLEAKVPRIEEAMSSSDKATVAT